MKHWYKPLTYLPKIEGVKSGTIRQTIRYRNSKAPEPRAGDVLTIFTWEGKPYRSPWGWRGTWELTDALNARLYTPVNGHPFIVVEEFLWDREDLDELARLDGIDPPTYEALVQVLLSMLKGKRRYIFNGMEFYPLIIWRW